MALTKIGSSGITANALTSLAIANGTIQAVDLADGAVTNDKLAGSITFGKHFVTVWIPIETYISILYFITL